MTSKNNNSNTDGDEFFLEMTDSDAETVEAPQTDDLNIEDVEDDATVELVRGSQEIAAVEDQTQPPEDQVRLQLEQELAEAIQARDNLKDQLFRKAADLENYRKRVQRERDELQKYGNEKLAYDLLPVLDNMERALNAIEDDEAVRSVREGVEMVFKQFVSTLQRFGITGFDSKGTPFEPQKHEALQQVETDEVPSGTVVDEFQRGYFIHDRLLRAAMVSVAKNSGDE